MIGGCADSRTDIQTDNPDRTKLHSYISISPVGSIDLTKEQRTEETK